MEGEGREREGEERRERMSRERGGETRREERRQRERGREGGSKGEGEASESCVRARESRPSKGRVQGMERGRGCAREGGCFG